MTDDVFVASSEEAMEVDEELRTALERAREDVEAGRLYTMDQALERVATWRTRSSSPTPR